jgi:DNA-binding protein HU-beta
MTRKQLAEQVSARSGINPVDTERTIALTLKVMRDTVSKGEKVTLRGFGTFKTKLRKERLARDINRKICITIPQHHEVVLKTSRAFRKKVLILDKK